MEDAYEFIARRHGFAASRRYRRLLEVVLTPRQASIAAELPAPPEEVARRLGLAEEAVKGELEDLFRRGVVSTKDIPRRRPYRLQGVEYLFSYNVIQPLLHQGHPQLLELWDEFCREEWHPRLAQDYAALAQPLDRVLPAYKALEGDYHPSEDIREIIHQAPLAAAIPCACRVQGRKCSGALETCLAFGWQAEYVLAAGLGKKLSTEEAMAAVDTAEEQAQVHTYMNSNFMQGRYICNCCRCCCVFFVPSQLYAVPLEKRLAKSRFQATLDPSRCQEDCQQCVPRCQFQALRQEDGRVVLEAEKCWGCGLCVIKCPSGALRLKAVRPLEHIPGLSS